MFIHTQCHNLKHDLSTPTSARSHSTTLLLTYFAWATLASSLFPEQTKVVLPLTIRICFNISLKRSSPRGGSPPSHTSCLCLTVTHYGGLLWSPDTKYQSTPLPGHPMCSHTHLALSFPWPLSPPDILFLFNCGKIYIKFTILTNFYCTVQ